MAELGLVVMETLWPAKPKIFTIWSFTKKVSLGAQGEWETEWIRLMGMRVPWGAC